MLGGRATREFEGEEIAVDTVAIKAAKECLRKNIRNLDVNSYVMAEYRNRKLAVGEDMKVMALREKDKITLTIGDAFVSKYVDDCEHYEDAKQGLKEFVRSVAEAYTSRGILILINMADTLDVSLPASDRILAAILRRSPS